MLKDEKKKFQAAFQRLKSLVPKVLKKSKGQFLIVSLIVSVMVIFAFVTIYPVLKQAIATAVPAMDVYSATLLQLTPFFMVLAIILTIVFAAFPVRE